MLVEDVHFLKSPEQLRILPDVAEALVQLDTSSPGVVLIDEDMRGPSVVEMMSLLKDGGYEGPAVILGANLDSLEEALEPARDLARASGTEEGDESEDDDCNPGGDHRVGDLEVANDGVGAYGLGLELDSCKGSAEEAATELVAEGAACEAEYEQDKYRD